MDQAKAGFVATISFRTEYPAVKVGDVRENFWRPIQQRTPSDSSEEAESIEKLENAVVADLPGVLHRMLMQHFQTPSVRFNELVTSHPRELHAVFFGVSIEGYSSALLAVDVGGVKELAELFNGNIDTFTLVMEAFVPAALAAIIPSTHVRSDFMATIAPSAELSRVFTQVRAAHAIAAFPGADASSAQMADRADGWFSKIPRALVATAFSLLTPIVLSLVVLYCAAQMLLQDRSVLSKREALLAAQEQEFRKSERAAASEVRKENVELLRLLRSPPASDRKP